MVVSPEHPYLHEFVNHDCSDAVMSYIENASNKSELQRTVDKLKQLNAQPKPQQTNHLAVVNTNALFAVQVGAYKNKAVLEAAIKQFQSASNKLEVNTEQVLIDQHTFYRLKLGAFKTKEAAKDACKSLINNNTCFVSYYVKTPQS